MMEMDDDLRKALTPDGLYLSIDGTTDDRPAISAYSALIGAIYNSVTPSSKNHRDGEMERIIEGVTKRWRVDWGDM
jgi:hypothetical protein